ncbi:MAG: alpha-galactosidase, partial [Propionibacteriaceae bacterium]|nr:alpha-galactosidase [Propionibacteriaceae bacterium]
GGNRFDLGILCFSPQIWASDCTDPVERLDIQDGLSYLYPPSTMGAHVTASPSAQTLRATPLSTRFNVAAFGVLGYEFDLTTLSHAERRDVRAQVAFYKRHRRTLQQGRFHRLTATRPDQFGWATVGKGEVIAGHFQTRTYSLTPPGVWQVPGLDAAKRYRITSRPQTLGLDDFGHLLRFVLPKWLNPEGPIVRAVGHWYRLPDSDESFTASGAALAAGYGPSIQFEGNDDRTATRMWADHGSTLYVVTPQH